MGNYATKFKKLLKSSIKSRNYTGFLLISGLAILFFLNNNNIISFLVYIVIVSQNYSKMVGSDIIYFAFLLEYGERHVNNKAIFFATHLQPSNGGKNQLESSIQFLNGVILVGVDIVEMYKIFLLKLINNLPVFAYLVLELGIFSIIQLTLYKRLDNNSVRKNFHFLMFIIFFNRNEFVMYSAHLILLFLVFMQGFKFSARFYKLFINEKEKGPLIFSHILLLSSLLYSQEILPSQIEYHSVLISVCILDSFSSIVGKIFKTKKKSIKGLAGGFLIANLVYFLIYCNLKMWHYFLFASVLEYLLEANDNLALPIISIYLFKNIAYFHMFLSWIAKFVSKQAFNKTLAI